MHAMRIFFSVALLSLLFACGSLKKAGGHRSDDIMIISSSKDSKKAKYDSIQIKYAAFLNVEPNVITNGRLYRFIDKWLYTPYKWGGVDKNGIDCSAFLQSLLAEVYTIHIPRTSVQQFFNQRVEKFRSTHYLSEGDLVFFRTMDNTIVSHVGLYLHNNMFINASSSKGVSIASLEDPYWKKRYIAAGRVRTAVAVK